MSDQWGGEDYSGGYPEQHGDAYQGDYYAQGQGYAEEPAAPPPEPKIELVDEDGVRAFELATLGWLVAFVALLPFWGLLSDRGWTWWIWTCLAAFGIGAFGIELTRRRRARRLRD